MQVTRWATMPIANLPNAILSFSSELLETFKSPLLTALNFILGTNTQLRPQGLLGIQNSKWRLGEDPGKRQVMPIQKYWKF